MENRGPGLRMPDFDGNIGEGSVSIVVIENIGVAGKTARAAHHGNALPLADGGTIGVWSFCRIKLYVIADEKIEASIAIIVEPGAARTPTDLFVVHDQPCAWCR